MKSSPLSVFQSFTRRIKDFGECCTSCWKRSELPSSSFLPSLSETSDISAGRDNLLFSSTPANYRADFKEQLIYSSTFPCFSDRHRENRNRRDASACFSRHLFHILVLPHSFKFSSLTLHFSDQAMSITMTLSSFYNVVLTLHCQQMIFLPGSFVPADFLMNVCVSAPWLSVGCSAGD